MEPPHLDIFLFLIILFNLPLLLHQVCGDWNLRIQALWRNPPARARLEAKLRAGWRSSVNTAMQLGLARREVARQQWLRNYIQDFLFLICKLYFSTFPFPHSF